MRSPATTLGCYDTVLPPLILTMTTNNTIKKNKNKGRVVDEDEIGEGSLSTLSTHASTLSSSSHASSSSSTSSSVSSSSSSSSSSTSSSFASSFASLASSRRSKSGKSTSTSSSRKKKEAAAALVAAVFNPKKVPQRSSLKSLSSYTSSSRSTTSSQNQRQRQQLPKRSNSAIQFEEEVYVREIRSAKSLVKNTNNNSSADEVLWFQENEYNDIRNKTFKLVSRVNKDGIVKIEQPQQSQSLDDSSKSLGSSTKGGLTKQRKYCTRGLERLLHPEETRVKRAQAYDAVLCEQYLQKEDDQYNDQIIADIYKQSCKRSQIQACRIAFKDAVIAEAILGTKFQCKSTTASIACSYHNREPEFELGCRRSSM
jgi:hypothetical protein